MRILALSALVLSTALVASPGRTENRDIAMKSGATLSVKTSNSFIKVEGWDQEKVAVIADIHDSQDRPVTWDLRPTASGVEVEAHFPKSGWSWHGQSSACNFTLKVPRKLVGSFQTSNDEIDANGLDGTLDFNTSNDTVTLENLNGAVTVHTSNGDVTAKHLHASLKGSTSNDDVKLEDVQGGIDFNTSNGEIVASGLDGWGQGISLHTSNGDMTIGLGQAKGEIHARTSNHESVNVELHGVDLLDMGSGHDVRLRVPGSPQAINLSTSNGTITLR